MMIFCWTAIAAISQRMAENWLFGSMNHVSFVEGKPRLVQPLPSTLAHRLAGLGGVTSMSDPNGQLLFFGDKYDIYNADGDPLQESIIGDIYGIPSQCNAVLAVPRPLHPYEYYYFYLGYDPDEGRPNRKVSYLTIDMQRNGGKGTVLPGQQQGIHNFLYQNKQDVALKITATIHCNKKDYWVIGHYLASNEYYAFLVTDQGVQTTPVISKGLYVPDISSNRKNEYGMLKVSPAGTRIGAVWGGDFQQIEIADFDPANGQLSNFRIVQPEVNTATFPYGLAGYNNLHGIYGIDFSPSGQYLYLSGATDAGAPPGHPEHGTNNTLPCSFLLQYHVLDGTSAVIKASEKVVDTSYNKYFAGMQTGPDGRIYIADADQHALYAIVNPESPAPNVLIDRAPLGNVTMQATLGNLPAYVQSFVRFPIEAKGNCEQQLITFSLKNNFNVDSIHWNFDDDASGTNNKSKQLSTSHLFSSVGLYNVQAVVFSKGGCLPDTVGIGIYAGKFSVKVQGANSLCPGDSAQLSSSQNSVAYYNWSTGDTSNVARIYAPGKYILKIGLGQCVASDTVTVKALARPLVDLPNDTAICQGGGIIIGKKDQLPTESFKWNTGERTPEIRVAKPGTFILTVTNIDGCAASDSMRVQSRTLPQFSLGNDTAFCLPSSILLKPGVAYDSIKWNTGINAESLTISKTGTYACLLYKNGCAYADTILVKANAPASFSLGNDTTLCDGASIVLSAGLAGNIKYTWSNGENTSALKVHDKGTYWLKIEKDQCISTDSIEIKENEIPVLESVRHISLCSPQTISLQAILKQGRNVSWNWSMGASSQTVRISTPGNYIAYASNECGSSKQEFLVTPGECTLSFPNAFSPNGDGVNDYFFAKGIDGIIAFQIKIVDRYGRLIFSSRQADFKWDGRLETNQLPSGVYYWICFYSTSTSKTQNKLSGSIVVLR